MKKQITNFNLGTGEYMINGVRYIVCGKFEDFNIKKYSDSNHLNNRLKNISRAISQNCLLIVSMIK